MEYREVTEKLVALDKEMTADAKAIMEAFEKQKKERNEKFQSDVTAVLKDWTKEDVQEWSKQACNDDTVDPLLYNLVVMAWALEHVDEVAAVGVVKDIGILDSATIGSDFMRVLGMVASIYEDLHG